MTFTRESKLQILEQIALDDIEKSETRIKAITEHARLSGDYAGDDDDDCLDAARKLLEMSWQ